jgi:hypothetical protein
VKAPDKFRLTIVGTTYDVLRRENAVRGLGHPLTELLCGQTLPDNIFSPWYLQVVIAEADIPGATSIHTLARSSTKVEIRCQHCGRAALYESKPLSELCHQRLFGSDLRDFGRHMLCDSRRGGCGKRGAVITPAQPRK